LGVRAGFYGYFSQEEKLEFLSSKDARKYLKNGEFPEGSMGPKIEAAIRFLKHGGKMVVIYADCCKLLTT
jgi:carbamate kinase